MTSGVPTRDRLIRSATIAFARSGYDAVSIRSITKAARTNLAAISFHFGSKEALYEAVLEARLALLSPPKRGKRDRSTRTAPLDQVVSALTRLFGTLREEPEAAALLFHQIAGPRPLSAATRGLVRGILRELTDLVAEGQAAGVIRGGSPALLAMVALSHPLFVALAASVLGPDLPWHDNDSEAIPAVVDHMERYVRAALAS